MSAPHLTSVVAGRRDPRGDATVLRSTNPAELSDTVAHAELADPDLFEAA